MKLYLNLKNGLAEIEASETPVEGFALYELTPITWSEGPKPRPDHIPAPPDGCAYYGPGPIPVCADRDQEADVYAFDEVLREDQWDPGYEGCCEVLHYAIRRGTSIAEANGIL